MSEKDDYSQLSLEWRAIVLKELTDLKVGQKEIQDELISHKYITAEKVELEKLKSRVETLEKIWWQIGGAALLLGILWSVIGHSIIEFFTK